MDDFASNSYHGSSCGSLNETIKEEPKDVEYFLKKLVATLKELPETECESSKQLIIRTIGDVKGIKNNYQSILEAVKSGNVNAVKNILKNKVDLELKDEAGNTALHIASQIGNEDLVNLLLEKGADIKSKNDILDTPLHIASKYGNANIVSLFLEKDVYVYTRNKFGYTPLHVAFKYHKENVMKVLLDYTTVKRENASMYELCDTEDEIQIFIDTLSQEEKEKLLHKAAKKNCLNIFYILLKSGVNINCIYHNETALHYASKNGNLESVKLLIQNKANIDRTHIISAIQKDKSQIVEYFLKNGYDINTKDSDGNSLLHECSQYNSCETAKMLLEKGVDIDGVSNYEYTPLILACIHGFVQVANVLLKNGANVNAKNNDLWTPIHHACFANKKNIVELLLLYKADTTCKNVCNETALDLARQKNYQEIVNILQNC